MLQQSPDCTQHYRQVNQIYIAIAAVTHQSLEFLQTFLLMKGITFKNPIRDWYDQHSEPPIRIVSSFQNSFMQLQQKLVPIKDYKKGEAGWRKVNPCLLWLYSKWSNNCYLKVICRRSPEAGRGSREGNVCHFIISLQSAPERGGDVQLMEGLSSRLISIKAAIDLCLLSRTKSMMN